MHSKYPSSAFTKDGIAMLSGVLNSDKAIEMNVAIMRAFVDINTIDAKHHIEFIILCNTKSIFISYLRNLFNIKCHYLNFIYFFPHNHRYLQNNLKQ